MADEPKSPELIKAEIAKAEAEAEAARTKAELNRAEARKAAAEAKEAECDARKAEMNLWTHEYAHKMEKAKDCYQHRYWFTTDVNPSSVEACIKQLRVWMELDPGCEIEIWFVSPGGGVLHGMALFDFIQQVRAAGHHVTTGTLGYAASMAGILLQAGDRRVIGQESYLMLHEISTMALGKTSEISDAVEFCKKIQNRVIAIFAERSTLGRAAIKNRFERKDWWLDSAEALKIGFVDAVVDAPPWPQMGETSEA